MKTHLSLKSLLFIFGIPIIVLISSVILASNLMRFVGQESLMANAITIDMVLIAPALYLILIARTKISKFTVTPFFIACVILATQVLPPTHHQLIDIILIWFLPLIELVITGIVIYSIIKVRRTYTREKIEGGDFLTLIRKSTAAVFPTKLAYALSMEISLFYYTLFTWKKAIYQPNEFTYHKDSGIRVILAVLLGVALVELFSVHLLLQTNYPIASWVFTVISGYGLIQIIGMIKSIPRTPIRIENGKLIIRMAIFSETQIPLETIDSIEFTLRDYPKDDKSYKKMALMDHNCILHLNEEQTIIGFFGIQKPYKHLVISVDDKEGFRKALDR